MDLEAFVRESLNQVARGVSGAAAPSSSKYFVLGAGPGEKEGIAFNVAVTVTAQTSVAGSGGLQVVGIGKLDGEASSQQMSEHVSRVKFRVIVSSMP